MNFCIVQYVSFTFILWLFDYNHLWNVDRGWNDNFSLTYFSLKNPITDQEECHVDVRYHRKLPCFNQNPNVSGHFVFADNFINFIFNFLAINNSVDFRSSNVLKDGTQIAASASVSGISNFLKIWSWKLFPIANCWNPTMSYRLSTWAFAVG